MLLRDLTRWTDGWTANGFRYTLAAVLYWPILIGAHFSGRLPPRLLLLCLIPAAFALAGQILWGLAPYHLDASAIGFFIRFSLVWSIVGSMILFQDERRLLVNPAFYIGLLVAAGGFVLLSISRGAGAAAVTSSGVVVILFCSIFFGFYAVSVKYFLRDVNPLVGFGIVAQLVSIGTLGAMFVYGQPQSLAGLDVPAWITLVASSILGIAMGHFLLYVAVRRLGASIASGFQTVTPFLTAALASLWLSEQMSPTDWAAGVATVAGAFMLLLTRNRTTPVAIEGALEPTAQQAGSHRVPTGARD